MWEVIIKNLGPVPPWPELLNLVLLCLVTIASFHSSRSIAILADKSSSSKEESYALIREQLRRIETLERRILERPPSAPITIVSKSDSSVHELDRVTLLSAQTDRAGIKVPEGSTGTVVAVLKDGQAYMVEFVEPIAALVTVRAGLIAPTAEAA